MAAENSVCLVLVIVNVLLQGVDESPLVMKYVRTEVGGNVTLDCGDEGRGKEGANDWYRSVGPHHTCPEQKVISENSKEYVLCERLSKNTEILKPELKERLSIANEEVSSSLTITNIEANDQGTYFCVRSDQTRVLSTSVLYIPDPTALTVDSSASSHLSPSFSSSSKEDSDPDPEAVAAAPLAQTSSRLPPSTMSSVVIAISFFVFVFVFFAFTSKFIYRRRKRCSSAKEDADCSSSAASDTVSVSIDKVSVASHQDFSVYHVLSAEDNSICGSSERIEPRPSVAAVGAFDDGIIYAELKASAEAGNLIISSSQPIENLFHRSIYAQIDHGIETAQRPT